MIGIDRVGPVAIVQMQPFNDGALKLIKRIKPRAWDEVHLCWEVPAERVDGLARSLYENGHAVVVDGVPFDPLKIAEPSNPFIPLFLALPERLRKRVHFDLALALGPDLNGDGDLGLFEQLDAAYRLAQRADQATAKAAQPKTRTKPAPVKPMERQSKPVRPLVRKAAS